MRLDCGQSVGWIHFLAQKQADGVAHLGLQLVSLGDGWFAAYIWTRGNIVERFDVRVGVLGEMYELGELSSDAHHQTGVEAAAACDLLVAVGGADAARLAKAARDAGLSNGCVHHVDDAERATDLLRRVLGSGDVVLVKGSRSNRMETIIEALTAALAAREPAQPITVADDQIPAAELPARSEEQQARTGASRT